VSTIEACGIVLAYLVGCELIGYALKRQLLGIALFRLRMRLARQLPIGHHGPSEDARCSVGKPDSVIVIRMPVRESAEGAPVTHLGVTNESTAFAVDGRQVDVDGFLAAYDDELGPISVDIYEPGVIAAARIDTRESPVT
jgi:hypothetical protein